MQNSTQWIVSAKQGSTSTGPHWAGLSYPDAHTMSGFNGMSGVNMKKQIL